MLAISIEYVTGRAVATDPVSRGRPEWPPHPGRLFAALVAALHAGGNDARERAALLWMEQQGPPAISAPAAIAGDNVDVYVPVNDISVLPRPRQKRKFPFVTLSHPIVHFIWRETDLPEQIRDGLSSLVSKLTRLGHSSSLVTARLCGDPPAPTFVADNYGSLVLRVNQSGQLEVLEAMFNAYRSTGQRVPLATAFQRYISGNRAGLCQCYQRAVTLGIGLSSVHSKGHGFQ